MKSPIVKRFFKRKASIAGLVVLTIFFLMAIIGPSLCYYDPLAQDISNISKGPSAAHCFGTDYLGRDTFTRIVYGARMSLFISFSGVLSGCLVGVLLGVCAGYYGGWVDAVISRLIDVMLAFPGLLLAIVIVAILGNGDKNTIIAIKSVDIGKQAETQ